MYIAFRSDASPKLGSGHVARCRRLAAQLREIGHKTLFLIRDPSDDLHSALLDDGNEVSVLLASSPEIVEIEDAVSTQRALVNRKPDWLIVDHYALGKDWETRMREAVVHLMVIDDLSRSHDCDLLLDQGWLGNNVDAYPGVNCEKLLGPHFALLPPNYAELRLQPQQRNALIARVLIFFGGADGTGQTLNVLEAIDDARFSHLHFDIVVGAENALRYEIESRAIRISNVNLTGPLHSLAGLMSEADLFIGAGGTTTWERCCLGLPAIVCWTAENQKAQTLAVAAQGGQVELGSATKQSAQSWRDALLSMLSDPSRLQKAAIRGMDLVDGRGVERVAYRLVGADSGIGASELTS